MSLPETMWRRQVCHWLAKVDAKGWVANHDGNATVRVGGGKLLATPTSFSKAEITETDLLLISEEGKILRGPHRTFGELDLHLAAYRARPDVGAVLHAHPPSSTALAVAGQTFSPCFIAEAVVSLGDSIPLLPYRLPGAAQAIDDLAAALQLVDLVLLQNHGVLSVGKDLEQAFLRMELCEHLATVHLRALPLGGPKLLPKADIDALLARRTKAGLGPAARASAAPAGAPTAR